MKIIAKTGREDIAYVYLAETEEGKLIEFVESIQPPIPRENKWVLIVSTLYGCPVKCRFCDCGGFYEGKISEKGLLEQIDYLITSRFPDKIVPVDKFKIQFARMGEPAFNSAVLDVLEKLPSLYDAKGLLPSLSTIAPNGTDSFFERLLDIKNRLYKDKFQLQFSIHSTDTKKRDWLLPVKKWSFDKISEYGNRFKGDDTKKVTLNFSLADDSELDGKELLKYFDTDTFLIKITPVNPTYHAKSNNISSENTAKQWNKIVSDLENLGYQVILSIGELEENNIGSNCGQYVTKHRNEMDKLENAYSYELENI